MASTATANQLSTPHAPVRAFRSPRLPSSLPEASPTTTAAAVKTERKLSRSDEVAAGRRHSEIRILALPGPSLHRLLGPSPSGEPGIMRDLLLSLK
ncbi:hypothetical protein RJ641_025163, partial [Dillenia turbinata]